VASITIPFRRRIVSTASRTSANARRRNALPREVVDDVGILDRRRRARPQPKHDLADDEAAGILLLESAHAIGKPAFRRRQDESALLAAIECRHRFDRRGHLLPVRADVLDGRAADGAGDSGQTLDAGEPAADCELNQRVPRFACSGRHHHVRTPQRCLDAAEGDLQHEAVEPFVGDHEIAAAAEHEQRRAARGRPSIRGDYMLDRRRPGEPPSRAADPQRAERRERHALLRAIKGHAAAPPPRQAR
jgi:hypothetical protein